MGKERLETMNTFGGERERAERLERKENKNDYYKDFALFNAERLNWDNLGKQHAKETDNMLFVARCWAMTLPHSTQLF